MKNFLKLKITGIKEVWINLDIVKEFILSDNAVTIVYNDENQSEWEFGFDEDSDTRKYFLEKMSLLEV